MQSINPVFGEKNKSSFIAFIHPFSPPSLFQSGRWRERKGGPPHACSFHFPPFSTPIPFPSVPSIPFTIQSPSYTHQRRKRTKERERGNIPFISIKQNSHQPSKPLVLSYLHMHTHTHFLFPVSKRLFCVLSPRPPPRPPGQLGVS